ncbi:MAG TPA: hypothetical protein VL172_21015, partial [Kofleriaceae bacterium]|nr:hypothetical protein [Kofleriaceae bacterium]
HRYGVQILAVDLASVAVGAGLAYSGADDGVAGPVFVGAWSLGAPAVHLFHGNPGRALVSAGLHVGLPIAGLSAGAAMANCSGPEHEEEWFCGLGEALIGGMIGGILATGVDAAFLAVEKRAPEPMPLRYGGIRATPTVSAADGRFAFGLSGNF